MHKHLAGSNLELSSSVSSSNKNSRDKNGTTDAAKLSRTASISNAAFFTTTNQHSTRLGHSDNTDATTNKTSPIKDESSPTSNVPATTHHQKRPTSFLNKHLMVQRRKTIHDIINIDILSNLMASSK